MYEVLVTQAHYGDYGQIFLTVQSNKYLIPYYE